MYHGGCPPHHDATSWGTVHANGKLVTCLWQDSSVSFEGFLEVKNTDIILVPTWSNIKSTMIFQDFPLALFCFIILFGNMSFGESVSHASVTSVMWVLRKMNDRILKHMTQPSYWPSSSASRKGTSSRSCAIDIIDMKSTKIKRWMLSMNLNNSQKVLLDPFKCLLNTCLSWKPRKHHAVEQKIIKHLIWYYCGAFTDLMTSICFTILCSLAESALGPEEIN